MVMYGTSYCPRATRMGLSRIFGLCIALLFASTVNAANIIDLGPSDYRQVGPGGAHTPGGIRSSFQQPVRMGPNLNTLNVTRNPVVPYGSVANGLRQFVRVNPASVAASAAVTGLFLAVDWVWDQAEQEWVKYEFECPVGEICAIDGQYNVTQMCARNPYALTEVGQVKTIVASSSFTLDGRGYPAGTTVSVVAEYADGRPGAINNCVQRYPSGAWPTDERGQFPTLYATVIEEPGTPEQVPVPVDFSELEAYLPQAPASEVSQAAGDAMRRQGAPLDGYHDTTITGPSSVTGPTQTTTSTDPETGSTTTTQTTTQTNIEYGDTTITTTNTTTTNTYVDGQHTKTETTTETPGELPVESPGTGSGIEWPAFCDWAVKVCDWLDWTQEDPGFEDPDLPLPIDEDYREEKTISFGAKSCPPDYEINIPFMNTSVGVSFQPLCDFAGIIYYMVMAAAYVIAAYISIGVARNG